MASISSVSRGKIMAYGGLGAPLAMIGYPIAIWLILSILKLQDLSLPSLQTYY